MKEKKKIHLLKDYMERINGHFAKNQVMTLNQYNDIAGDLIVDIFVEMNKSSTKEEITDVFNTIYEEINKRYD